jgi:16S rRNA (adenine1518-N6/adenine1519-N6)-dimethyltransferase
VKPKKRLGQHFLTAPSYAKKIAAAIPAGSNDHILEIGPGRGALSIFLIKRFPGMHLVEYDVDVIDELSLNLGKGSWVLHQCDILKFDFSKAGFPLHVVGNLPYSIGAMIIKKTLFYGNNIFSCTFMVQREVAQRIAANPGTKQNGFLSIFCRFFGEPKILFHVPPGAFFPKPNVDSSIVQIMIRSGIAQQLSFEEWPVFFAFVDKGFKMRRKILINALWRGEEKSDYVNALRDCHINVMARAEDLSCGQWLELFRKLRGI